MGLAQILTLNYKFVVLVRLLQWEKLSKIKLKFVIKSPSLVRLVNIAHKQTDLYMRCVFIPLIIY